MTIHRIRISQVTRVERSIVVEVEAETMEAAIEMTEESDSPSNDAGWTVDRDELQNEEVEAA